MIIKTWKVVMSIVFSIVCIVGGISWMVIAAYFVANSPKILGYFMLSVAGLVVIGAVAQTIYESILK